MSAHDSKNQRHGPGPSRWAHELRVFLLNPSVGRLQECLRSSTPKHDSLPLRLSIQSLRSPLSPFCSGREAGFCMKYYCWVVILLSYAAAWYPGYPGYGSYFSTLEVPVPGYKFVKARAVGFQNGVSYSFPYPTTACFFCPCCMIVWFPYTVAAAVPPPRVLYLVRFFALPFLSFHTSTSKSL